jgi:hypothetical protein
VDTKTRSKHLNHFLSRLRKLYTRDYLLSDWIFFQFPERADEMQISPKLIIPPGLFDACLSNELFVTERTPLKKM